MFKRLFNKNSKLKYVLIILICVIAILVSLIFIGLEIMEQRKQKDISTAIENAIEIVEEFPQSEEPGVESVSLGDYEYYKSIPFVNVNFNDLLEINPDTKAWLQVAGTEVNYPVVQHWDGEYYLNYAFDGTPNKYGWIFFDPRNDSRNFDDNTIIFGHNGVSGIMFQPLHATLNDSWYYNSDHIVKLSTPTNNTLWHIFSVYIVPETTDYLQISFLTTDELVNFADTLKSRSMYDFEVTVTGTDKILTLSTCYKEVNRLVIHAKMVVNEAK